MTTRRQAILDALARQPNEFYDLDEATDAVEKALDALKPEVSDAIASEIGFELRGKFHMEVGDPPSFEGGDRIGLWLSGAEHPVSAVVTRVVHDGPRMIISFSTQMVMAITVEK